jgi:hypothetical protein
MSKPIERVEIITGRERCRRYSAEGHCQVVGYPSGEAFDHPQLSVCAG